MVKFDERSWRGPRVHTQLIQHELRELRERYRDGLQLDIFAVLRAPAAEGP